MTLTRPRVSRRARLLSLALLYLLPVSGSAQARTPDAAHAGSVTSSADPRATDAGREMLAAGGSATDAAIAMMLTLTLVEPQSSGIGGGGFLVHHAATGGAITTIDGRETAPAAATPDRFLGADGQPRAFRDIVPGGLSVGVPGNIALAADAHRRWGKLPWARLFQPAIRLAEDGFEVTSRLHRFLTAYATLWADFPDARAIYWRDGAPAMVGTRLTNPAYAATLRAIARGGAKAFYAGANARAITAAVAGSTRNPAALTAADLAAYRARERPAVCAPYRRFRVCGMGPPSSGATTVIGILGMIEGFDMGAMGPDSPMAWHVLAEAMRLAYADREAYLGDPDHVTVPVAGLTDRAYLAARAAAISPWGPAGRYAPGTPPGAPARTTGRPVEEAGTTHFVAVDAAGNVVSMTSTVESIFGSHLIAGGYFLNNELTDFAMVPTGLDGAAVANAVAPGKRPLSSMAPTIAYDADGRVVLALGSAGGKRIIMHVAKTLVGVLDWGLPADRAIALPNLYFDREGVLVEDTEAGQRLVAAMAPFAGPVKAAGLESKVNAAERTPTGWRGAADARGPGTSSQQ